MTFLFWLSVFYTLILFTLQVLALAWPPARAINSSILNAFYLMLLSAYVGGKEFQRWKNDEIPVVKRPYWLQGEWIVGLWAVFLPVAVLLPQLWPARFVYPEGLTLIVFEVFGFYATSGASAWLNKIKDNQDHATINEAYSADSEETRQKVDASPRLTRKRQRYEKKIQESARASGGVTREQVEKLLGLERTATLRILSGMADRGLLRRNGDPGSNTTLYTAA